MFKKYTQWGLEGAGSVLSLGPSRRQPHIISQSNTCTGTYFRLGAHQGAPGILLPRIRTLEWAHAALTPLLP